MNADFSYDPVTAVDEATATGATADIFADIRAISTTSAPSLPPTTAPTG
jgi:hypothetical protein